MFFVASATIAAEHPELADNIRSVDEHLFRHAGNPLRADYTSELLGIEHAWLTRLMGLFVDEGVVKKLAGYVCPRCDGLIDHVPSEGDLWCGECEESVSLRGRGDLGVVMWETLPGAAVTGESLAEDGPEPAVDQRERARSGGHLITAGTRQPPAHETRHPKVTTVVGFELLADDDWTFLEELFVRADLARASRKPWLLAVQVDPTVPGWEWYEDSIGHREFVVRFQHKLNTQRNLKSLRRHVEKLRDEQAFDDADRERCEAILASLSKPQTTPVAPTLPPVRPAPESLRNAFLSTDAIRGAEAMENLLAAGPSVVPVMLGWLPQAVKFESRTRDRLVLHRFKTVCAQYAAEAGPQLLDLVKGQDWEVGPAAAECFESFADRGLRIGFANELGAFISAALKGSVLDRPNPVRHALLALGHLGAWDWKHKIFEVLVASATDRDAKFHSSSLTSAGLLVARKPANVQGFVMFLGRLSSEFQGGRLGSAPDDGEWERYVDRALGRRKSLEGADEFLGVVRHGLETLTDEPTSTSVRLIGSAAQLIGALGLPQAVGHLHRLFTELRSLKRVFDNIRTYHALRFRVSLAAARIPSPLTATTFLAAPEPLEEFGYWAAYPALRTAHLAVDPAGTLGAAMRQMNVSDASRPAVARAIGLCRAGDWAPWLEAAVHHNTGLVRGTARLALARVRGIGTRASLEADLHFATSPIERLLTALALIEAGGSPPPPEVGAAMSEVLFEMDTPADVVDETVSVLDRASTDYQAQLEPWLPVIAAEPANTRPPA